MDFVSSSDPTGTWDWSEYHFLLNFSSQIRATLKKKAFEEAGIKPIVQQSSSQAPVHIQNIQEQQQIQIVQQLQQQPQQQQQIPVKMEVAETQEIKTESLNSAHMTLNRLNAHDVSWSFLSGLINEYCKTVL